MVATLKRLFPDLFLLILISLSLFNCSQRISTSPFAKKGVIDLRSWDFAADGVAALDGEWNFHWEKLFEPTELIQDKNSNFYKFPKAWNQYESAGQKVGPYGYATYHLKVLLGSKAQNKALYVGLQNTAYRLYINGKLLKTVGIVGTTKDSMEPKYHPTTLTLFSDSDTLDLVIQLSNFHNRFGGSRTSILIGEDSQINHLREKGIALDLMVFGGLFFMGIYHMSLFLLRKKDQSALYFAIFALLYALKTLLENERYLIELFPSFPWEYDLKISYIVTFSAIPIFSTFLHLLYPREFHTKIIRVLQVIGGILVLSVLLTQANIYSFIAIPHQIYLGLVGIYGFIMLFVAVRRKREGAKSILLGFVIYYLIAGINDSLYSAGIIHTFYASSYALFIFAFTQGLAIAVRFTNSFRINEKLSDDLALNTASYGRFVPKEFIKYLGKENIRDVKIGDQVQKKMTILFSDIRSFSQLSEAMTPAENFNFVNSYLKRMNPYIIDHNGFIDKFIGDAIMAIFPESADDALRAAIGMLQEIKLYNVNRASKGYKPIQIGIGINTGLLMMGTVGDLGRMNTTVIGDSVNLSARLESLTKTYLTPLILSDFTYRDLKNPDDFCLREIDSVHVKGKSRPVTIYECYDLDSEEVKDKKKVSETYLMMGLSNFKAGNFHEALDEFSTAQQILLADPIPVIHLQKTQDMLKTMELESKGFVKKRKPTVIFIGTHAKFIKLAEEIEKQLSFDIIRSNNAKEALTLCIQEKPEAVFIGDNILEMEESLLVEQVIELGKIHRFQPLLIKKSAREKNETDQSLAPDRHQYRTLQEKSIIESLRDRIVSINI
jgi:adenylate cyclase